MRVVVTGGAGYIGSHAADALARAGHEVVLVDNLSRGHQAAVDILAERHPGRVRFVACELSDRTSLRSAFAQGADAVMHFAAFANVGEGDADPTLYYNNNVASMLPLLEAIRDHRVPRVVYSSSCSVYGQPPDAMIPVPESAPLAPLSAYGRTKLIGELMLEDLARAQRLAGVPLALTSLRYFNVAGCEDVDQPRSLGEDHEPELHLIPLVLRVALGRTPSIRIFGDDYDTPDGTCVRDYVHVADVASAHVVALDRTAPGETLACNLGTGRGFSVLQIIDAARRVTGHPIPAVVAPRRSGDPARLFASAEWASRRLGWRPVFTQIDQIIETAWRWFRRHPTGY